MTDKSELEEARAEMLAILDGKLANVPEWRAFRAMDRALAALSSPVAAAATASTTSAGNRIQVSSSESYGDLALKAIRAAGQPLATSALVEYMRPFRPQVADIKKLKINIQSAMSRDKRIKSVQWQGAAGWWPVTKPLPSVETAGTLLEAPAAAH